MRKAQVQIIVVSVIALIGTIFTSWATASKRVSEVETEVAVVVERENNHFEEVQKQLTEVSKKLDTLLNQGKQSLIKEANDKLD